MSLNSAMNTGVSGLNANAVALANVSNNIANVNTVGYKQGETEFLTLVTGTGEQAGRDSGGVLAINRQLVDQQGQLTQTSSPLDLAIQGQGFFVTTTHATNLTATDPRLFTRAGSFTVNDQGYLVNAAGLVLQGWPADANGVITPNPSSLTSLQSINVSQVGGAVSPTTQVGVNANLNAGQTISAAATAAGATPPGAGAYDPAANSMAMWEADNATGVQPDYSIQVPISDSQGGQHNVQLDLIKSSTPNQWYAELVAVPASDVVDGAGLSNGQIATGMIAFTPTGQIDTANSTLFGAGNASITLGASSAGAPAAGQVNWAPSLGIGAQTVSVNLGGTGAAGGLTQLDSASNTQSITTNGTQFGNLTNVEIDKSGIVTAVYSNGVTRSLAQVAIATFPDPDSLAPVSGNAYQVTQDSGAYTLQQSGQGSAGEIEPSELESSTVDLSSQLTQLITSQSAYSASSKIITTANQMMQTLLNVIQ
ncbi:MAG TPA: flagellar hook protein FlgE [Caulobacteraceae bacterium]|jgi:flagellar hook protein FlgE|nr:flagellar hook protein FlgE [Caulobacteraceae bacterium]